MKLKSPLLGKRLGITLLIYLQFSTAYGITLHEALKLSLTNNPDFKILQEEFRQEAEQYPKAFANSFMPRGDYEMNWSKKKSGDADFPSKASYSSTLSAQMPLFNFGSGLGSLKTAKRAVEAAKYKYYNDEQEKVIEMINLYLDYHLSKEVYEIQSTAVEAAYKNLESAQEKFKLGEATQTDVAIAKANLANAEFDKLKSLSEYNKNHSNFVKSFGVEPSETTLPEAQNFKVKNELELLELAFKQNFGLKATNAVFQANKVAKFVSLSSNFAPQVSLSASITERDPENLLYFQNKIEKTVGISVKIPIISHGGKEFADVRTAISKERKSVLELDQAKKRLKALSKTLWEQYQLTKSSITTAEQAVKAEALSFEGTKQEYNVGNKSFLDVLNAQKKLFDTTISYKHTIINNLKASYQVSGFLGQLTVGNLKLNNKPFDPEKVFRNLKYRVIGF